MTTDNKQEIERAIALIIGEWGDNAGPAICEADEVLAGLRAVLSKLRAVGEPIQLQHLAVADEYGLRWMSGRKMPAGVDSIELYAMPNYGNAPDVLYAAPQASAEVRNAALEEAAKECEAYERRVSEARQDNRAQHFMGAAIGASACADAVRALKSAPAAEPCRTDVCQAAQRDGVLCADDECDIGAGIRSHHNACMFRNECRAMLDRQQRAGDDFSGVKPPMRHIAGVNVDVLRRAALAAQPAVSADPVLGEIDWPTMPPSRRQSHVLFEDGYAEGWAKCMAECQKAVTLAARKPDSGDAQDAARWRIAMKQWRIEAVELFPGVRCTHKAGIPRSTLEQQADAAISAQQRQGNNDA